MLAYIEEVWHRTYENQTVSLNLVISNETGSLDISHPDFQKLLDPLASSPQTYFRVDGNMKLIEFCEIPWDSITESKKYKYHPEFVHPIHSQLVQGELAVHLTSRGDLLILNRLGILCALRKGRWYVYDPPTFKNSIGKAIGDYHVGCVLFEIIFDLSYRRQGALLVFDPDHQIISRVANRESKLESPESDAVRLSLSHSIKGFEPSELHNRTEKRLFLELASLDGAMIFDRDRILAAGAMIESHSEAGQTAGARTLASNSALLYGGHPIKISSDGDVIIPFYSETTYRDRMSKAEINFS